MNASVDLTLDDLAKSTPTYVLANAISSIPDLIPASHRNHREPTVVYCGVQLNGPPHLGTALTLATVCALAVRAGELGIIEPHVVLDVLDNTSHEEVREASTGSVFRKSMSEALDFQARQDVFDGYYRELTNQLAASGVKFSLRFFSNYRQTPQFKRALIKTIGFANTIGRQLNPRSAKLPIRFPCPTCGMMEVHSTRTELIRIAGGIAQFKAYCLEHGVYEAVVSEDSTSPFDLNALYRNLVKDTEHWHRAGPPAISAKGTDWLQGAGVLNFALSALGVPEPSRPFRLFTPLVTDSTGAKLSKSGAAARSPNSDRGLLEPGSLPRLFQIALGIVNRPPLFFRGYTAELLRELLRSRD
ncbi:MAG: hypothetical protein KKC29_02800 [Alphaproteobacteria bacterium]|jgi:hypothetical protein|nr:hypothetical protein [Alphaproteobacteria bacterium]MBU2041357.1 hypothetical protein [Alphaproteobacteria bacterium]MBU2125386.1 hypothetical protein [Alphaproteobacteria bacterium]MBU2209548.1 hypothetical protein [Alphaproteobacteria bacterium]MBU2290014.1 hypothetical protein [Alphaproteobacteria bacterium]